MGRKGHSPNPPMLRCDQSFDTNLGPKRGASLPRLWSPRWGPAKKGNRQPHLPGAERNRTPGSTSSFSQEDYRPPSSVPPRNRTYGSVFFVLCSLYFIVFYMVIVQFDSCLCIVHCHCSKMNCFGVWWLKRNQNHIQFQNKKNKNEF